MFRVAEPVSLVAAVYLTENLDSLFFDNMWLPLISSFGQYYVADIARYGFQEISFKMRFTYLYIFAPPLHFSSACLQYKNYECISSWRRPFGYGRSQKEFWSRKSKGNWMPADIMKMPGYLYCLPSDFTYLRGKYTPVLIKLPFSVFSY